MSSDSSVRSRGKSRRGRVVCGAALLASACIGDNPIDVDAGPAIHSLLGGLAVGEALTLQGQQAERIPLPGSAEGADFVIIPFLGTEQGATVILGIRGAALVDAVGPPVGRVAGPGSDFLGGPALAARLSTARFHEQLRRREIERLEPSLRSMDRRSTAAALRASETPARVPAVGDVLSLRTINDASADICASPLQRDGRVVAVSNRAIIVSDVASPAELGPADVAAIASEFDALVYPVDVASFGAPSDVDANGRIIVFFTPVVNDREAAGFFFAGDLFPQSDCAASNLAEIVYIISPDPTGQTALPIDTDDVAFIASGIIAHEVQHLINASRRIFVNDATQLESVWLNEGLSHIAEELVFYEATPFEPGENLDLEDLQSVAQQANRFVLANNLFYASYAANPTAASLTGDDNDATRGAAWAFLRYASDQEGRPGAELFHDLVNSTSRGLVNLNQVLETGDALDMMQAWTASVYSDDHVDDVPAFLTQPSWNFRSTVPAILTSGAYPLSPQVLQANGGQVNVVLDSGASAFFRIQVGAGRTGEVELDINGSPSNLRVTVLRAR